MPELTLLATAKARINGRREVTLSRKFFDGVVEFQRHWPGSVSVMMEPAESDLPELDRIAVRANDLPFQLSLAPFVPFDQGLHQADVVLAMLATRYVPFQQASPAAWVWFAEHSLQTRRQIAWLSSRNPVVRLRRVLGAHLREPRLGSAASTAAGVQCNGTPAFEQYRRTNANSILYFDTRLRAVQLATQENIHRRMEVATRLRLGFSGRLITIKGADHLVDVAMELRRIGVPFELTLFGEGDLTPLIEKRVAASHMESSVKLGGVIDFSDELVPRVISSVDVFICCHRQGDPSSTYLETLGCGVPIAGYANEALAGVIERSRAGWLVPMDRPELLARKLAKLWTDREEIRRASINALDFARRHTFEQTFKARADHLLSALPSGRQYAVQSNVAEISQ